MRDSKQILKLTGLNLPGRSGLFDLPIKNGLIASISESDQERSNGLALPAFYEPHVHANRAYSNVDADVRSLAGAIEASVLDRETATVADYRSRSERLFRQALSMGTLAIRTHTDLDKMSGFRALEGIALANQEIDGVMDVETVAFLTTKLDPASDEARAYMSAAKGLQATYVGAVPAFYDDPARSIDAIMEFAANNALNVDLHVDEHLNADRMMSEYAAQSAIRFNLEGRVTLSHCSTLSQLADADLHRVIDTFLQARVDVVSLPATNLCLQDRNAQNPRQRGVTALNSLLEAGVPVLFGSDNVRDFFFRYGNADPLESAFLAALSGHVRDDRHLLKGICGGVCDFNVGGRADLVILQSASFDDALSQRPLTRRVLRDGICVSNPSP